MTSAIVLVEALDANGVLCPLADNLIKFKVDGPAEIAGIDNGNPLSYEPFQDSVHKLFFGKAMLILRTKEGQKGDIRLIAESDGLHPSGCYCAKPVVFSACKILQTGN